MVLGPRAFWKWPADPRGRKDPNPRCLVDFQERTKRYSASKSSRLSSNDFSPRSKAGLVDEPDRFEHFPRQDPVWEQ